MTTPQRRRRRFRSAAILMALMGIAVSTQGCALAVAGMAGYMISQHDSRKEQIATCRQNLATTNADRLAHGKDAFPDQCGG